MKRSRLLFTLAWLSATACTADVVELFPDAGLADAAAADAGTIVDAAGEDAHVADAGMLRADTGADPWDAGRTPVLRCPTALGGELNAYGVLVREDLGIKVSAAPNWTTVVTGSTQDRGTVDYTHRHAPSGLRKFRSYAIEAGEITTPPHLASLGDDRSAILAYSNGRSPTIITGVLAADRGLGEQMIGPIQFANPLEVLDVVRDGEDLVLAVGNAEGQAWLLKRTLDGEPTGWRQFDLTPSTVRLAKLRMVERDGRIWISQTDTDGYIFEMIIEDGRWDEITFDFDCRNAELLDAAAMGVDRFLYVRTCSGYGPEVKLHSIRTSLLTIILQLPRFLHKTPPQVAYDGRVIGVAEWLDGAIGPSVRFYDEEFGYLSAPLVLDLSDYVEVLDMDLAGSVDVNGRFSHWILGIVARKQDGPAESVVLNFEGCWLE